MTWRHYRIFLIILALIIITFFVFLKVTLASACIEDFRSGSGSTLIASPSKIGQKAFVRISLVISNRTTAKILPGLLNSQNKTRCWMTCSLNACPTHHIKPRYIHLVA